jgi:hypothetical protein
VVEKDCACFVLIEELLERPLIAPAQAKQKPARSLRPLQR